MTRHGGAADLNRTEQDRAVRAVLADMAKLSKPVAQIGGDEDLFHLGLDSHAVVEVMLALEDRLGVEFPESRLTRAAFSSVDAIVAALRAEEAA